MQVRLLAMLDEYNYLRQEKDEEKRRLRVCTKYLTTFNIWCQYYLTILHSLCLV